MNEETILIYPSEQPPDESWTIKEILLWVLARWPDNYFRELPNTLKDPPVPKEWLEPVVYEWLVEGVGENHELRRHLAIAFAWAQIMSRGDVLGRSQMAEKIHKETGCPTEEILDVMRTMDLDPGTYEYIKNFRSELALIMSATSQGGIAMIQNGMLQEILRTTQLLEKVNDHLDSLMKTNPSSPTALARMMSAYARCVEAVQNLLIPLAAWGDPDSYFNEDGIGGRRNIRRAKAADRVVKMLKTQDRGSRPRKRT